MNKILIIDDEVKLRSLLARILSFESFEVIQAGDINSGIKTLEHNGDIDIVICDVKLPDGSGVDAVKLIKEKYAAVECILLTAYGNIPDGVQAIKNGAFDYITKGDDNNKIIPLVHKAMEKVALSKRLLRLEKQLGNKYSFDSIIGTSKSFIVAIEEGKRVASTDATVLLTGETGTGKEVFAQAIHIASKRNKNNFVAVNCAAFSRELLENELFGHKAGAYTGAAKDTKGIFEEANNGTVFLDEIGEMPLPLQAKLLRVIESGEFLKVGDSKITKVNVRIIAATNRDFQKEIEQGNFREDLYYRLAVFSIHLPSLRERQGDIEDLATYFLSLFTKRTGKKITSITPEYLNFLKRHTWKGNVRELKNIIERSVILTDTDSLKRESLPIELQSNTAENVEVKKTSQYDLASVEKNHIQMVLNHTKGNKTKTAELLNIALTTLYRKMNEYGLQ